MESKHNRLAKLNPCDHLVGFESKFIEMYPLNFSELLYAYTIKFESKGAPKKCNRVVNL